MTVRLIIMLALQTLCLKCFAQSTLKGNVYSTVDRQALAGASLHLVRGSQSQHSSANGSFSLQLDGPDTLVVTHVGFVSQRILVVPDGKILTIYLDVSGNTLDEVEVNTGYYQIPKERATGSFTHVDNKLLNRSVGPNILQRLEGIAPGVQFVNAGGTTASDIRVRGVATIESNESPLIVVDNFPYERDINTINPNDVESITVLRDAAAASIWGARAGNGVIVITTKQGRYNQKAQISFNSNFTIGEKPDLFYDQNRLPSATMMEIEKELFDRGNYAEQPRTVIPAYAELLIKRRDGLINETDLAKAEVVMKQTDVRDEAMRYLYRGERHWQYALNVAGGGESYRYYLATGYDKNDDVLVGNNSERFNINLQNTFRPLKGLEMSAGIWYTQRRQTNNGLSLSDLAPRSAESVSTYIRLADEIGNALPIPHERRMAYYDQAMDMGLLDWHFRPLDELTSADRMSQETEYRLNTSVKYSFLSDFNLQATYEYARPIGASETYYDPKSYYVRNLVNRFTQADGTQIVPKGGVLEGGADRVTNIHSGRMQLNYSREIGGIHRVIALVGGEVRQRVLKTNPGFRIYNYDRNLLTGTANFNYSQAYPNNPSGSARLGAPSVSKDQITDRFLSYFTNAAYTYNDRYTLSGSLRWDASNLFGVKTNQKGVPLWSVGGSWVVSKESFYNLDGWLPHLRLRATYGSAGNVNKLVSVFPTVSYSSDVTVGLPVARVRNIGNPSLRWEQVNTINVAMDIALFNRRLYGNVEYYSKYASDLIGEDYLPPSTGINSWSNVAHQINYANLRTHGWDVQLTSRNVVGTFSWESIAMFSHVRNEITHFNTGEVSTISRYFSSNPPPSVGRARDVVYAYPWIGLDHETGMPLVQVDGEIGMDYTNYIRNFQIEDLLIKGVRIPPYYGSLMNTLAWKQLQISFNIVWKAGYVFKRRTITPGEEYANVYHMDYFKRWQKPGDEIHTDVPAWAESVQPYLSQSYMHSEALVSKGDHIRLQDVSLAYSLSNNNWFGGLPLQRIRFYAYARNLGILWRANRSGIDPDYQSAEYTAPSVLAMGIQLDF